MFTLDFRFQLLNCVSQTSSKMTSSYLTYKALFQDTGYTDYTGYRLPTKTQEGLK